MTLPYVLRRRFNPDLFMDYLTACGLSVSCVSLVACVVVRFI